MAKEVNPKEELVEEMSQLYVQFVFDLVEEFAPERPWWHEDLTAEQQLWRWMSGPRNEIMQWLYTAGMHMGWEEPEETLKNLEELFTSPTVTTLLPLPLQIQIPTELVEMVQSAGPADTAKHIRKMEKMAEGSAAARSAMTAARESQPNVPEPPDQPPPLPTELVPGTEGWPLYGAVPRDDPSITPGE